MSGNLTVFPGGHLALQNHFRKEGTQAVSESVGQAWLAAARHLAGCKHRKERNLVLEISAPQKLSKDDVTVIFINLP